MPEALGQAFRQLIFSLGRPGGGGLCGLNRVYLEAGTRVFCYLIKKKERQLPNKPYVGFWVGKAGNLNNLNIK